MEAAAEYRPLVFSASFVRGGCEMKLCILRASKGTVGIENRIIYLMFQKPREMNFVNNRKVLYANWALFRFIECFYSLVIIEKVEVINISQITTVPSAGKFLAHCSMALIIYCATGASFELA